jgi:hypothetical protein
MRIGNYLPPFLSRKGGAKRDRAQSPLRPPRGSTFSSSKASDENVSQTLRGFPITPNGGGPQPRFERIEIAA